jgi:hypothetical protein
LLLAAAPATGGQQDEEKKGCGAPHSANLGEEAAPAAES